MEEKIEIEYPDLDKDKKGKIEKALEKLEPDPQKWRSCKGDCSKLLKELIKEEIESTFYILNLLQNSTISEGEDLTIVFYKDSNYTLTNEFETDMENITMKIVNTYGFTIRPDKLEQYKQKRLILGFGPSASGKTFWAEEIIKLMSTNNDEFPKFPKIFLQIDGGLAREHSKIYQEIIRVVNKKGIAGIENLVYKIDKKSLFNSDKIKVLIETFLEKNPISLYVPLTLSFCGALNYITFNKLNKEGCEEKYNKYIKITGDNEWIGLFIYQHKHKNTKDCPFPDGYKCEGTITSGEDRQQTEGKKYSSNNYERSFKHGIYNVMEAKGANIIIHNSGSKDNTSIIFDFSEKQKIKKSEDNKFLLIRANKSDLSDYTDKKLTEIAEERIDKEEIDKKTINRNLAFYYGGKRKSKKYHNNSRKKSKKKFRKRSKKGRNNKK
tara:strand:- start:839 stop:2149 length:1311 start_codon:yes stop_codon:yes gene_type:complete